MSFGDWARRATAGVFRRPTTLVRVGRPEPLPGPPPARRELPAPPNQPNRQPARGCGCGSQGLSAFGRVIADMGGAGSTTGRPQPIGRGPAYEPVVWDRDQLRAELFGE